MRNNFFTKPKFKAQTKKQQTNQQALNDDGTGTDRRQPLIGVTAVNDANSTFKKSIKAPPVVATVKLIGLSFGDEEEDY